MRASHFLAAVVAIFVLVTTTQDTKPQAACTPNFNLTTYTPRFGGDPKLSSPLSEVLNLQLWTTLRKNADGENFGCGSLVWDPLGADADEGDIAHRTPPNASLSFWGQVTSVGDGVVVQGALRRAPKGIQPNRQIWALATNGRTIQFDPIRQIYSFAPFVVKREVVDQYTEIPELRLCADKILPCKGRPIGRQDIYALQQEGSFAKVTVGHDTGWVYLPRLADHSEVISFVAGVIRIMRGDYRGAIVMMDDVLDSQASTSLKVDALVIQAVSLEIQGSSGVEQIEKAKSLSPYATDLLRLYVMDLIRQSLKELNGQSRANFASRASKLLDEGAHLFPSDDQWLHDARSILKTLQ